MPEIDYSIIKRALTGPDKECGDTGLVIIEEDECFIAHIDALGHGGSAYEVAMIAEDYLSANHDNDLLEVVTGLHTHLKGTIGAVAAVCRLNIKSGKLEHVGVGNITVRIFGRERITFVSRDGVVGYSQLSLEKQIADLKEGDVLVITSDGIREHYRLEEYPDLLYGSADEIALKIMDNLAKGDDDVSCLVLRYK